MPDLSSLVPQGVWRFIGSRLVRSLITLVLFQLVLFALIQSLNRALPGDMQELELAISAREDLSAFQSGMSTDQELSIDTEMSPDMEISTDMEVSTEPAMPTEQETSTEKEISTEPVPWWGEFVGWMTAFYRGDLGESSSLGSTPVTEILKVTLPRTLLLLIPGTIGGFLLGMWLGKRIAWRRRGWNEFAATLGGTAFYTAFPPWLAFVMINVFGLSLDWFPPEKLIDPMKWAWIDIPVNDVIIKLLITLGAGILVYLSVVWLTRDFAHRKCLGWRLIGSIAIIVIAVIPWIVSGLWTLALDILNHLVLPLATLILLSFGETMLIMKTTMMEAVVAQHVSTARAKGLPDVRVRDRHAARVAILPVLTHFTVHLPFIIIGSFVVEHFFFWDGMGQELVRAANDNDLPVLLGVLSVVAIGILLVHTSLDILTTWLDPRLRKVRKTKRLLRRAG